MSKREDPLDCESCGGECRPQFTTAHWNWGRAAAAHGAFIEETMAGHHDVVKESTITGTREELLRRETTAGTQAR